MNNAPLVELIAEIRWGDGLSGSSPTISFGGDESLFMQVGMQVGKHGYEQLERIVPHGIPLQSGNVVYRYRNVDEQQKALFQSGFGIFTVNGLPPYKSWSEFVPVVRLGIEGLFATAAFPRSGPIELFVRYVDAFQSQHLGDLSAADFFEKVLGVSFETPSVVKTLGDGSKRADTRVHLNYRNDSGDGIILEATQGQYNGNDAVLLNTIAHSAPFNVTSADDVVERFSSLQSILHDLFIEMVERDTALKERLAN